VFHQNTDDSGVAECYLSIWHWCSRVVPFNMTVV